MNFTNFYLNEDEKLFYVSMTAPFEEEHRIIAIADNEGEATKLVVDQTPLNCQVITLKPMTKIELQKWLDKMAEIERRKGISYTFYHGQGIDKRWTTL